MSTLCCCVISVVLVLCICTSSAHHSLQSLVLLTTLRNYIYTKVSYNLEAGKYIKLLHKLDDTEALIKIKNRAIYDGKQQIHLVYNPLSRSGLHKFLYCLFNVCVLQQTVLTGALLPEAAARLLVR